MAPLDADEYGRWMEQSEHTYRSAVRDSEAGDYDWAAFKAQQAAEYALKGLLRGIGRPAFGHALRRLLEEIQKAGIGPAADLVEAAQELDAHYLPARYPDAYPESSPYKFYNRKRAEAALHAARLLREWVKSAWDEARG